MRLKLAFSYAPSDLFRVTAVVKDGRSHSPEPVIAQYKKEGVFCDLLLEADIDPETQVKLFHAISAAITAPDSATCCEDVEFSPEQLEILRLDSVLTQRT
jgi:hypothetical protein